MTSTNYDSHRLSNELDRIESRKKEPANHSRPVDAQSIVYLFTLSEADNT